jgi:hypothetical protein
VVDGRENQAHRVVRIASADEPNGAGVEAPFLPVP